MDEHVLQAEHVLQRGSMQSNPKKEGVDMWEVQTEGVDIWEVQTAKKEGVDMWEVQTEKP